MLSRTGEYAIRAMVALRAHGKDSPMLAREISDETGIPSNYLSKIMHTLGRTGLVSSTRGPGGGFFLNRTATQITAWDIVAPFEILDAPRRCLLGNPKCDKSQSCAAHDGWERVQNTYENFLKKTNLKQLTSSKTPGAELASGKPPRRSRKLE